MEAAWVRTLAEKEKDLSKISHHTYKKAKKHFLAVLEVAQQQHHFDDHQREEAIRRSFAEPSDDTPDQSAQAPRSGWNPATYVKTGLKKLFGLTTEGEAASTTATPEPSDSDFLSSLRLTGVLEPVYADPIGRINDLARAALSEKLKSTCNLLVQRMEVAQTRECIAQGEAYYRGQAQQAETEVYSVFRTNVNRALINPSAS